MPLPWESYRDILEELWIAQNKTHDEIITEMKRLHNFNATKNQYTAQFKKWGLRKNITNDEWRLINQLIIRRREDHSKESEVYFNNVKIPDARIRKEISRNVLPTFKCIPVTTPLDSQVISIRTPPPTPLLDVPAAIENFHTNASSMVHMKRKRSTQHEIELPSSKQLCKSAYKPQSTPEEYFQQTYSIRNQFKFKEDSLPYFEFLDLFNSLSFDGPIVQGNIIDSRRSLSMLPSNSSFTVDIEEYDWSLDVDAENIWLDSSVECSAHHGSVGHFYESLARILIPYKSFAESQDQILAHRRIREQLPNILANMPERYPGERESTIETLLGPPQLSAALRLLEVVIYLYSNNYLGFWESNSILQWVVDIVPFQNLSIILRTKLPTLQPFQNALLVHGIQTGNTLFVKNLLKLDTGLQEWIRLSKIPLKEALGAGDSEMLKIILDICPEIASNYHWIAGHSLDREFPVSIVRLLVGAGVDILGVGWGFPCLIKVIGRGDIALARYLISIGADVNLGFKRDNAEYYSITPLRTAVNTDRIDLVRLLLENHADVHAVCESGDYEYCLGRPLTFKPKPYKNFAATALQAAASNGNIDIVMSLLKAGSNINEPAHGNFGQTALYAATNAGNLSVAKLLIQSGANINAPGCDSTIFPRPVLLVAIENNDYTLAEFLIKSGANSNAPAFGYHGTTLLEAARNSNGNERIVSLLLAKGAEDRIGFNDPARNDFMRFQLLQAIGRGDSERVLFLIERGVEVNMIPMVYEVDQIRWFSSSCHRYEKPIIEVIIEVTMLHLAITVENMDLALFTYLLKHTKKSELEYNGCLQPLLNHAVSWGRAEFVGALLDAGVHINTISPLWDVECVFLFRRTGPTALYIASALGNVDIVSLLLNRGADINLRLPDARTPLQASLYRPPTSSKRHLDVYEILVSRGADVNAPPARLLGFTALQTAIKALRFCGSTSSTRIIGLIQRLLSLGARVNDPPARIDGRTALQAASELGNLHLVLLLLSHGAEVNAPPAEEGGGTALQYAAKEGHIEIAQLLIERGAEVNDRGDLFDGSTALECAAAKGHIKIVQLLLERGAEVNSPNIDSPALHVAARHGRLDMVQILIDAGADHNLPVEERYVSALRHATIEAQSGVISLLQRYRSRLVSSEQDRLG